MTDSQITPSSRVDAVVDRRAMLRGMGVFAAASALAAAGTTHAQAVGPWGGYSNGAIPTSALVAIPWAMGRYLRADACQALVDLNRAFRARFSRDIGVTDAYRDYATQVRLKAEKGAFAAKPGTSNHGWALATDLASSINSFGTPEHEWMRANAPAYGWIHPSWAHDNDPNNGQQEPWHWEYIGGGESPSPGSDPDPIDSEEDEMLLISSGGGFWLMAGGKMLPIGDGATVNALRAVPTLHEVAISPADRDLWMSQMGPGMLLVRSGSRGVALLGGTGGWSSMTSEADVTALKRAGVPEVAVSSDQFTALSV